MRWSRAVRPECRKHAKALLPRAAAHALEIMRKRQSDHRAVEEEFDAWLGRARYERRPDYQRGLRNGFRPRRVQTAEGELSVELPQVRAVTIRGQLRLSDEHIPPDDEIPEGVRFMILSWLGAPRERDGSQRA